MPHHINSAPGQKLVSRAERARHYLIGTGVAREDSDDELGLEDLPWEWIYRDQHQEEGNCNITGDYEPAPASPNLQNTSCKRRASHRRHPGPAREIIGARMGRFECRVGDCVLLKAEGNNEAWVGMICEYMEDEDGVKAANFMWFSTEKEIRNKEKKRTDFMQVFQLLLYLILFIVY